MTHFVGLVVANDEDELEKMLAPYDEQLPGAPVFTPIKTETVGEWNEFESMAKAYGTDDVQELLKHMEEWNGGPGEIKDGVLGYYSTYNENSKWDWYVVGGRWQDIVPSNECLAEEVIGYFDKNLEADKPYIPSVVVDRKGWHTTKDFGWWGISTPVEGQEDVVKQKLEEHKGKKVFIVDFHI